MVDYEQVDGDSGDEEEEEQQQRRHFEHKRNRLPSLSHTASTSITDSANDCTEPLNAQDRTGPDHTIDMKENTGPPLGEERKMASNFDKFRLLMWKNGLLQWRHKVQTIVEIMVPVLFSVILILIR